MVLVETTLLVLYILAKIIQVRNIYISSKGYITNYDYIISSLGMLGWRELHYDDIFPFLSFLNHILHKPLFNSFIHCLPKQP